MKNFRHVNIIHLRTILIYLFRGLGKCLALPGSIATFPDTDPDPDPTKWYGSDRIRIRNAAPNIPQLINIFLFWMVVKIIIFCRDIFSNWFLKMRDTRFIWRIEFLFFSAIMIIKKENVNSINTDINNNGNSNNNNNNDF